MKFSIALVALFCVAAISAAPTQGPKPFVEALANLTKGVISQFEKLIPNWNPKAAIEDNLLPHLSEKIALDFIPGWNPKANISDNVLNAVMNLTKTLETKGLDDNKSVAENVKIIVAEVFEKMPFFSFVPKEPIEQLLTNNALESFSRFLLKKAEANKTEDVKGFNPNVKFGDLHQSDYIDYGMIPGFNTNKTLAENAAALLEDLFRNSPF
ncbi:uncharacterized protein LOC107360290 [Tetranychus urticae]|uniref:Uncharacterized protein n=1 Tax=Tetranychus urticae TaxID=32264 RepID=T1K488_TETUR|nr:uncharacterized protein LOC107360290 [Tetranychus urticae]